MAVKEVPAHKEIFTDKSLVDIAKENLIEYGNSVILERALPDYRDGLKPIHRRILYSMFKEGLKHNTPYSKSAGVVGDVMKRYHPHGDLAIYGALVKMTHLPVKSVDPMGNFGTLTDKKFAAQRYCLTGDARINTSRGNIRMDDIPYIHSLKDEKLLETEGEIVNLDIFVQSLQGKWAKATKWINSGKHEVTELKFSNGFDLSCTGNEPILVLNDKFEHEWVVADDLKEGMFVACNRDSDYGCDKKVSIEEAAFMGYILSDGYVRGHEIQFSTAYQSVLEDFSKLADKCGFKFNYSYRKPHSYGKRQNVVLSCGSTSSVDRLKDLGVNPGNSYTQKIPEKIWESDNAVCASFLSAYFEGDGSINLREENGKIKSVQISAHSVSSYLLNDIRLLLWTRFGIISKKPVKEKNDGVGKRISISHCDSVAKFLNVIGFRSKKKIKLQKRVLELISNMSKMSGNSKEDILPYYERLPSNMKIGSRNVGKTMKKFAASWNKCDDSYHDKFQAIVESGYFYTQLMGKKSVGKQWVYDLTVEGTHAYTANTIVVHNTEVRLTKYGEHQFFPKYMDALVPFVPNYDGKYKEPLYLPCLMPNLFLNGTEGIAVGITSNFPSISMESLMPFLEMAIQEKQITSKKLASSLVFNWEYGSHCITEEAKIREWIESEGGKGSLRFEPDYEVDYANKLLIVKEAPPHFNWDKTVENICGVNKKTGKAKYPFVSTVEDMSDEIDPIRFEIKFKNTVDRSDIQSIAAKLIASEFTTSFSCSTNMTFRKSTGHQFFRSDIISLIERWCRYRVNLEVKRQAHLIKLINIDLEHNDLLLKVIENRHMFEPAWKSADPDNYMIKNMKLTEEQAKLVMSWNLRAPSNLNKDKILTEKAQLMSDRKTATAIQANPSPTVISYLNSNTN